MAEFSAGAVIAMLALVETTVLTLFLRLSGTKADDEDVDDVEETAEAALEQTRANERAVARVERVVETRTDGGHERENT